MIRISWGKIKTSSNSEINGWKVNDEQKCDSDHDELAKKPRRPEKLQEVIYTRKEKETTPCLSLIVKGRPLLSLVFYLLCRVGGVGEYHCMPQSVDQKIEYYSGCPAAVLFLFIRCQIPIAFALYVFWRRRYIIPLVVEESSTIHPYTATDELVIWEKKAEYHSLVKT